VTISVTNAADAPADAPVANDDSANVVEDTPKI
jgi:hypothetical protein